MWPTHVWNFAQQTVEALTPLDSMTRNIIVTKLWVNVRQLDRSRAHFASCLNSGGGQIKNGHLMDKSSTEKSPSSDYQTALDLDLTALILNYILTIEFLRYNLMVSEGLMLQY